MMPDAFGDSVSLAEFRPGSRVVIVGDAGTGRESKTTRLGSQGTINAEYGGQFEVVLDDERIVVVTLNMLTEDDEMPVDPDKRQRVEALIQEIANRNR